MSNHIKKFIFKNPPKTIIYIEGEPFKLTEAFDFFHNKTIIRNKLTPLQHLFKSYLKNPLLASGIRDSYLKEEYSEKYLIILFTTPEIVKKSNEVLSNYSNIELTKGCFFLITTQDYMLLLTKDVNGLSLGVEIMKEILNQVLEDYFNKKNFEDFIKITQFKLSNCIVSK